MAIKIPGMDVRSVPILAPAKERHNEMANSEEMGAYRDGALSARGKPNQANPAAKSTFNVDDIVVGGGNRNSYKDYNASEDDYNSRVSPRSDGAISGNSRGAGKGAAGGRSNVAVAPPTIADVCVPKYCNYMSLIRVLNHCRKVTCQSWSDLLTPRRCNMVQWEKKVTTETTSECTPESRRSSSSLGSIH